MKPQIQRCNGCGAVKALSDFARHSQNRSGRQSICRSCTTADVQRRRHGMTREEKAALVEAQGGCALCQTRTPGGKGWVVDHDHRCCGPIRSCKRCRRGLLCQNCNTALGMARDNPELLRRMADYIEAHTSSVHRAAPPSQVPQDPPEWESHAGLASATPTRRTDVRTYEEVGDLTRHLTSRNAREQSADSEPEFQPGMALLADTTHTPAHVSRVAPTWKDS